MFTDCTVVCFFLCHSVHLSQCRRSVKQIQLAATVNTVFVWWGNSVPGLMICHLMWLITGYTTAPVALLDSDQAAGKQAGGVHYKKREVTQHLHFTHTIRCRTILHLSQPWGCALRQPARQASVLVRKGGTCHLIGKEGKETGHTDVGDFEWNVLIDDTQRSRVPADYLNERTKPFTRVTLCLVVKVQLHFLTSELTVNWKSNHEKSRLSYVSQRIQDVK